MRKRKRTIRRVVPAVHPRCLLLSVVLGVCLSLFFYLVPAACQSRGTDPTSGTEWLCSQSLFMHIGQKPVSAAAETGLEDPELTAAQGSLDTTAVYPGGFPIGIYLRTKGVLVVRTAAVPDSTGNLLEPAEGLLEPGDCITAVNGEEVCTKETFQEIVSRSGGQPVTLTRERNGEQTSFSIAPVSQADGSFRLGIWIKDDTQGIGTMTYLTADGHFGALGHPISDADTGQMVLARDGGLYEARVKMIIRGTSGSPGSYSGVICYSQESKLGTICENSRNGIFGTIDPQKLVGFLTGEPCRTAPKDEVSCKEAVLRCTLSGETKEYQIRILQKRAGARPEQGFLFQVTDPELLEKTGGIVQGMSGAPILQDGRLIGAVTHVFVQDSSKGYGIYIEDMRKESGG